mmetsp:Transcript_15161/g.17171  ORF Transcript_15161/g.17171 Transcript_15161/m.17171 type:complete len:316 (+) Transcript_15161:776-1723(+)
MSPGQCHIRSFCSKLQALLLRSIEAAIIMGSKTALVTGASRGIGRSVALELARNGFTVIIAARTLNKGEKHQHGLGRKATELPGSLEETARMIENEGGKAKCVRMDISNQKDTLASLEQVLKEYGGIDVFVNNAVYKGNGNEQLFLDLDDQDYRDMIQCNVLTPVAMIKRILGEMLRNNSGKIFHLSSSSIHMKPKYSVQEGGWDFAYSSTKAAIAKLIPMLAIEHKQTKLCFYNVEPGLVVTDLMRQRGKNYAASFGDVPPEVTAKVIGWLSTTSEKDATRFNGKSVYAPKLCEDLQLLDGYSEKKPDASLSKL